MHLSKWPVEVAWGQLRCRQARVATRPPRQRVHIPLTGPQAEAIVQLTTVDLIYIPLNLD